MTLADKSLAFARSIGEEWQDRPGTDLRSFQQRYLYAQAFGTAHTARGYWILHREEQHHDCNLLARNLLERIFNGRVASKSPRHAVELMTCELSEHIRRLRLFQRELQHVPKEATQTIERLESELQVFLALLGTQEAPQWDYHRRAVEAEISTWAYRGLYSEFSCYTHAGYEVGRPRELNKPSNLADFIALLAPLDTAMFLHRLSCTETQCEIGARYKTLYEEFRNEMLGEPTSENRQLGAGGKSLPD